MKYGWLRSPWFPLSPRSRRGGGFPINHTALYVLLGIGGNEGDEGTRGKSLVSWGFDGVGFFRPHHALQWFPLVFDPAREHVPIDDHFVLINLAEYVAEDATHAHGGGLGAVLAAGWR